MGHEIQVRYVSRWRNLLVGLFVVVGAVLFVMMAGGAALEGDWWGLSFLPVGVALGVFGVRAFRAGVNLSDDCIVVRDISSTRRYPWRDLRRASVENVPSTLPSAYSLILWLADDGAGSERPVVVPCLAVYSLPSRAGRTVAAMAAAEIQRRLDSGDSDSVPADSERTP